MTNDDLAKLEAWQASPEGNIEYALYELGQAIEMLGAFKDTREGVQLLKRYFDQIAAESERLMDFRRDIFKLKYKAG